MLGSVVHVCDWSSAVCSSQLMVPVHAPASAVWLSMCLVFFFKQKTAYERRISDWSSDVCSSDLLPYYEGSIVPHLKAGATVLVAAHGNRSEERRVGKECVSTCRSRWSPYH